MADTFVANGGKLDEQGYTKVWRDLFSAGYSPSVTDGWKVTDPGLSDMTVKVGEGSGFIEYADSFLYPAWSEGDESVAITAADGSNPRRDIVVAYIDLDDIDTSVTNNPGALKFMAVSGTAAGSPSDPTDGAIQSAVGGSNPFMKLARVAVAAGATTISNVNITDLRTPIIQRSPASLADSKVEGIVYCTTNTVIPASTGATLPVGMQTGTITPGIDGTLMILVSIECGNSDSYTFCSADLRESVNGGAFTAITPTGVATPFFRTSMENNQGRSNLTACFMRSVTAGTDYDYYVTVRNSTTIPKGAVYSSPQSFVKWHIVR